MPCPITGINKQELQDYKITKCPCTKISKIATKSGVQALMVYLLGLVERGKLPRTFLFFVFFQIIDEYIYHAKNSMNPELIVKEHLETIVPEQLVNDPRFKDL